MADQNCTGHIADNLAADKRGHECAASIQNGAKEIGNGGDLSNVPAKNEEADKCHHQGVIGLCEYPSVGNGKNNDDNGHAHQKRHRTNRHCYAECKQNNVYCNARLRHLNAFGFSVMELRLLHKAATNKNEHH